MKRGALPYNREEEVDEMKSGKLIYWQAVAVAFTWIVGTLFHFLYDWSGEAIWAALFTPVNESIWEHLKLLFFPTLFFFCLEYAVCKESYPTLLVGKTVGIVLGLWIIPLAYYWFLGALGIQEMWLDIAIFLSAVLLTEAVCCWVTLANPTEVRWQMVTSVAVLCLIAVAMMVFTFVTPHLPIFRDPITGGYGLLA